jgi:glutamate dehydrogenase/leucine dehydrogenase
MKATWQCAFFDLPFGGSAGAIVCAPEDLSEAQLRWIVQAYIERMGGMVSRFSDVVIPPSSSHCRLATWMMDACGQHAGLPDFAAVMGKPSAVWGLAAKGAWASGVKILLEEALAEGGAVLNHQTAVVQGFGNLGSAIVRELHNAGAKVTGVADISGALYREDGIDAPRLESFFQQQRMLYGYPDADPVCNADLLEAPANILILAAAENQVTRTNAEHIRARMVVEVAENAVSVAAEKILSGRGILVIPEFLANGGALVSAFLEWMQGLRFCRFSPEEIQQALKTRIVNGWHELRKGTRDVRRGALRVGVSRVAETLRITA